MLHELDIPESVLEQVQMLQHMVISLAESGPLHETAFRAIREKLCTSSDL